MAADFERKAGAMAVIVRTWVVYFIVVGLRLIVLGGTGKLMAMNFSWRELEVALGAFIISSVIFFLLSIERD